MEQLAIRSLRIPICIYLVMGVYPGCRLLPGAGGSQWQTMVGCWLPLTTITSDPPKYSNTRVTRDSVGEILLTLKLIWLCMEWSQNLGRRPPQSGMASLFSLCQRCRGNGLKPINFPEHGLLALCLELYFTFHAACTVSSRAQGFGMWWRSISLQSSPQSALTVISTCGSLGMHGPKVTVS